MVCSSMYDFSGGVAGDGVMETVLYHRIKFLCCRSQTVVVYTTLGIDIGYLLPDTTLAGANRTNPLKKFAEVVSPENGIALFQTIIIKYKAFTNKFVENPGCPLAKKRSSLTINAVSNTDNSIEIVKSPFTFYLTVSLSLNCSNFSNS